MRGPRVAPLVLALVAAPALAGIPVGPAPGGMHCVVVNTDTCTVGPFQSLLGYGTGFEGAFVGDIQLITEAEGYWHSVTCPDAILVGMLPFSSAIFSTCFHEGVDPPLDLPVTMTCVSRGTGAFACSVID